MHVLVTGATGQVGANIVAHLNRSGIRPRVLIRSTSRTLAIADLEWEPVIGDVTDLPSVRAATVGAKMVFHAAGFIALWRGDKARAESVNVEGTRNVVSACLQNRVERLVCTSSIAAVGYTLDPKHVLDESAQWNFDRHALGYNHSKRRSEQLVLAAVRDHGLSAVCLNPSMVLGERDVNGHAGQLIRAARNGQHFAPPGGTGVCDADDLAVAHLRAADHGKDGHRYIVSHENLSFVELLTMAAELTGGTPPKRVVPAAMLQGLGRLIDLIPRWGNARPLLTYDVALTTSVYGYVDGSRARSELGVPATPARESMRKAMDWFRHVPTLALALGLLGPSTASARPESSPTQLAPPRPEPPRIVMAVGPILGPHEFGREDCRGSADIARCERGGVFLGLGGNIEARVKLVGLLYAHIRFVAAGNVTARDRVYSAIVIPGFGLGVYHRLVFVRGEVMSTVALGSSTFVPPFETRPTARDEWGYVSGLISVGVRIPLWSAGGLELWGGPMIGPRARAYIPEQPVESRIKATFLAGVSVYFDVLK